MDKIRETVEQELQKARHAVQGWEGVLEALGRVTNGAVEAPVAAEASEPTIIGPSQAILQVLPKGTKLRISELTDAVMALPNYASQAKQPRSLLSATAQWMAKRGKLRARKVDGRNIYSRA